MSAEIKNNSGALNHIDVATNITEKLLKEELEAFSELSEFLCFNEKDDETEKSQALYEWIHSLPDGSMGTVYSLTKVVNDLYELYGTQTVGFPSSETNDFKGILKEIGFLMRDGIVLQDEQKNYSMLYLGNIIKRIYAFEEKLEKSTEPKSTWIKLS